MIAITIIISFAVVGNLTKVFKSLYTCVPIGTLLTTLVLPGIILIGQVQNRKAAIQQISQVLTGEASIVNIKSQTPTSFTVTTETNREKIFGAKVTGDKSSFIIQKKDAERIQKELFEPQGIAFMQNP